MNRKGPPISAADIPGLLALTDAAGKPLRTVGLPASQEIAQRRRGMVATPPAGAADFPEPCAARPWPKLKPPALHGVVGRFVQLIEPQTEADPVALAVQFLIAAGSVVGRYRFYGVEGVKHYPNLFALLVGDTAKGRKGTSWAHVKNVMEIADPEWVKTRVISGLSSGEGLIYQVRDPAAPRPASTRNVPAPDSGVIDKRLQVTEGEFATALRAMHRQGNTLSGILRSSFDFGDIETLTKNSPLRATGAHISLVGHITSDELRRELDRTEYANGLANRFLFVAVKRAQCLPFGGEMVDGAELTSIGGEVAKAATTARENPGRLDMDRQARELWVRTYPELSAGRRGLLGALTARAEAHAVRLATVYAILDGALAIQERHLLAALALWDYCDQSVQYVFGDAFGDPDADTIYNALRSAPAGLTGTDVRDLFRRHRSGTQVDRAVSALLRDGLVTVTSEPTSGRPVQRLRLAAPPRMLPAAGDGSPPRRTQPDPSAHR